MTNFRRPRGLSRPPSRGTRTYVRSYRGAPAAHAPGPERYLKRVIALCVAALLALPILGDATLGIARPMAGPEGGNCRIVRVTDGDTVDLWCGSRGLERARLLGFDTPELFSPQCASEITAALAAKWHLRRLIWEAETVSIRFDGTDRYQRLLAEIDIDGTPLAERMIADGHARAYGGERRAGWCG